MPNRNYKTKLCSTCHFWSGRRELGLQKTNSQQNIRVVSRSMGICKNPMSIRFKKNLMENASPCKNYLKWDQIIFEI